MLHGKTPDLYYDPAPAVSILFGARERHEASPLPIATLTYTGGATVTLTDSDAVAELRRWCEKHAENW